MRKGCYMAQHDNQSLLNSLLKDPLARNPTRNQVFFGKIGKRTLKQTYHSINSFFFPDCLAFLFFSSVFDSDRLRDPNFVAMWLYRGNYVEVFASLCER